MKQIQPIVIFPFHYPQNTRHIQFVYKQLKRGIKKQKWNRAITVLNRQTEIRLKKSRGKNTCQSLIPFKEEIVRTWSVDTCQLWLAGFGAAFDGTKSDVFWLIPGDFEYDTAAGAIVWQKMTELPECVSGGAELALGEIEIGMDNPKHLIDTYGTLALLSNWFPGKTPRIQRLTGKPRSEFLAVSKRFLKFLLDKRWFPYEQTIAMLLHALRKKKPKVSVVKLGQVLDSPHGRDRLTGALEQVERMERMIKLFWRERHAQQSWEDEFRRLDFQSGQIRAATSIVLQQALLTAKSRSQAP